MKAFFSKIIRNEFFKGGVIVTVSSILINFLNYLFNFLAGRFLGPIGYGEIYSLFSYITVLSIPTTILVTIIIQKIGSADGDKTEYARALESLINKKMLKYSPALLLVLIIVPFLARITNLSPSSSLILIPLLILTLVTSIYTSILNGLKFFLVVSVLSLLATLIKLVGALFAALHLGDFQIVLFWVVISAVVGLVGSIWALQNKIKKGRTGTTAKPIEKRLIYFFTSSQFIITGLSITAITALNNIDIIFVKKFFLANEAGLYSSWSLFAKGIFYVLGPLLFVSYVFFSQTKNDKDEKKSFTFSLVALCLLGVLSFIFYSVFASTLINVFFGTKFAAIIPYLGQASIYGSLYAVITFMNNFFLAKKSKIALILPISLPLYICGLFLFGKELSSLYVLNNVYALGVALTYLFAFFLRWK